MRILVLGFGWVLSISQTANYYIRAVLCFSEIWSQIKQKVFWQKCPYLLSLTGFGFRTLLFQSSSGGILKVSPQFIKMWTVKCIYVNLMSITGLVTHKLAALYKVRCVHTASTVLWVVAVQCFCKKILPSTFFEVFGVTCGCLHLMVTVKHTFV